MAAAVRVNDVLDGRVVLDVECLDRIYLNGYVPNLQVGGQVASFAINCPLTIHQHRPGTAACRRARHVGASVTAGSEVPMLGKSAAASCGIGSGLDVVAAHHGSGGRGSGCPDSYSGEGGGCGKT